MKWSDFDNYLTPEALGPGRHVLTILEIRAEEIYNAFARQRERVAVVYFTQTPRGIPCNSERRAVLARAFGDDVANAIGKKIIVEARENGRGGKTFVFTAVTNEDEAETKSETHSGLPAFNGLVGTRIKQWMRDADIDTTMFSVLQAARAGGFTDARVTNENFDSFCAAVMAARAKEVDHE